VEALHLPRQTKARLVALLAEDRVDSDRLLQRLRTLRSLEKIATCSAVLHLLTHLSVPEDEAERMLKGVLGHRGELCERLGRDPGLRVATIDYLSNVRKILRQPTIVERAELERTERRAFTDSLTGLFNRGYFEHTLALETRRCRRYGAELALLMLDLDTFKSVNDLYGHLLGDLVLKRTGEVLRRAVRESDFACRFGGEEFAVILPQTPRLGAFIVAERIRAQIRDSFSSHPIDGRVVQMTISGGIAVHAQDGEDTTTLIACADQALYHAKERGRDRIIAYHAERRRSVRFPFNRSARVTLAGTAGGPLGEVEPLNLSLDGALVASAEVWAPEAAVQVTLAAEARDWVVPGRVVRVESLPAGDRRRVAVAFDRPITEECLRGHTIHRRGPGPETGAER
jgi:diguanylate cyclase (GGDEF)-like protein